MELPEPHHKHIMLSSIPDDRVKLLEAGPETPEHADVVQNDECAFLKKLPAELRNQIYTIVAVDHAHKACMKEATTLGMALVNKQISSEYPGILNSKETMSAKYLVAINSMKWQPIDVRVLFKKHGIFSCNSYATRHTMFYRACNTMSALQNIYYRFRVAKHEEELVARADWRADGDYFGMIKFAGPDAEVLEFSVPRKKVHY